MLRGSYVKAFSSLQYSVKPKTKKFANIHNNKMFIIFSVTSSEKIDETNKYNVFRIVPTPYPGCEFFYDFKKNNYSSEGLMFNWTNPNFNSSLKVKPNPAIDQLDIPWSQYKVVTLRNIHIILIIIMPIKLV